MAASPEPMRLGARLRGARERAGLTVIEAAERLHVDPGVIEGLEAERFDALGASVYVRGHIRHYAELVGEPVAELQGLYSTSAHAARTPDLTRVPKGTDPTAASRALLVPAIAVVVAVAVIGTAWWIAGTLRSASRLPYRGSHPPPQALRQSAVPARARVAEAPATASLSPPPRPSPPAGVPVAHPGEAPGMSEAALNMRFTGDSWTEVYDARGERLFYDIGTADSTRTVHGVPPLKVVLGNPTAVSLELDGRPVSIPDGAERNVRIEFRVTRSGRAAPSHLASAGAKHSAAASAQAP